MPIPGDGESSGGKRRAVLLLSLILLVWNAGATARHIVSPGFPPPPETADSFPSLQPTSGDGTDAFPAERPRGGPPTIRQKYLLGKRVDINRASLAEIAELPGITDKIAAAVVEERERIGRFRSPDDLLGVKGIKGKRLQKILPFLAKIPNN